MSKEWTTLETRSAEVMAVCTAGMSRWGARLGVGAARIRVHGRSVAYAHRARASEVERPDAAIAGGP